MANLQATPIRARSKNPFVERIENICLEVVKTIGLSAIKYELEELVTRKINEAIELYLDEQVPIYVAAEMHKLLSNAPPKQTATTKYKPKAKEEVQDKNGAWKLKNPSRRGRRPGGPRATSAICNECGRRRFRVKNGTGYYFHRGCPRSSELIDGPAPATNAAGSS